MKWGDHVWTPEGPGIVRGFKSETSFTFGRPHRSSYVIVELDGRPESRRSFVAKSVEPRGWSERA